MRVLLIEDSEKLQTYIGKALKYAGYAVDFAGDGEEGLYLAENINYDVLILDLMLPKLDGLSILRKLREEGNPVHILVLTAKDTVADRVAGLRQGADRAGRWLVPVSQVLAPPPTGDVAMTALPQSAQNHLRQFNSIKSMAIKGTLEPLLDEPPKPVFNLRWDEDESLWQSQIAYPNELPKEIKEVFRNFG